MILVIDSHQFLYEIEALCRMFLRGEELKICDSVDGICENDEYIYTGIFGNIIKAKVYMGGKELSLEEKSEVDQCRILETLVYRILSEITGIVPKWGTLTGIRPVKTALSLNDRGLDFSEIREKFKTERLVSDEKLDLLIETAKHEVEIRKLSKPESVSLYISIPFCPSRCSYCSFISNSIEKTGKLIPGYIDILCGELRDTAKLIDELGLRLESIYMGGGTPTVLTAEQLDTVLSTVRTNFNMKTVREITVEAGRPDTITAEKLKVLKKNGVGRISINPQTMNDDVLVNIGRKHTAKDIIDAYDLARNFDFDSINMDLISGLPGDDLEKFKYTVNSVIDLDPENITLHTLTVKHGANMAPDAKILLAEKVDKMNEYAFERFSKSGYFPYYLYRQKGTVENLENTGFCKERKEGIYNIFIMDETHTILATGAGGVTKLKAPYSSKIERIFNFKYPYEYLERFELMSVRKKEVINFYEQYPIKE